MCYQYMHILIVNQLKIIKKSLNMVLQSQFGIVRFFLKNIIHHRTVKICMRQVICMHTFKHVSGCSVGGQWVFQVFYNKAGMTWPIVWLLSTKWHVKASVTRVWCRKLYATHKHVNTRVGTMIQYTDSPSECNLVKRKSFTNVLYASATTYLSHLLGDDFIEDS